MSKRPSLSVVTTSDGRQIGNPVLVDFLERMLADAKCGEIVDAAFVYVKNGEYEHAVIADWDVFHVVGLLEWLRHNMLAEDDE